MGAKRPPQSRRVERPGLGENQQQYEETQINLKTDYLFNINYQYGNQHSTNKVAECIGYECGVKGFLERVFFLEDKMIRQQLNQNRENHCREIVNNQTQ